MTSDRCIGFLLFAVAAGVVAAVVLTIVKPNFNKIAAAANITTNVSDLWNQVSGVCGF